MVDEITAAFASRYYTCTVYRWLLSHAHLIVAVVDSCEKLQYDWQVARTFRRAIAISLKILIIAFAVLGSFLFYPMLPRQNLGDGPTFVNDLALLIVAVLCACFSLLVSFGDENAKSWEMKLLFVFMASGSGLSLFLAGAFQYFITDFPGWRDTNPIAVKNLFISSIYLSIICLILGSAALAILLRVRRHVTR